MNHFSGCVAAIQARMGSSRLPGKVLQSIGKHCLLDEVSARATASGISRVVVATSTGKIDDAIEDHCLKRGFACYRGSELDVLDRLYHAALAENAGHLLRLTADNPLFDAGTIRRMVTEHLETQSDYTHCITSWGCLLPYGTGAEIFTMESLTVSWMEGREPEHREHVNEFVYAHPGRFKIHCCQPVAELGRPQFRLTIDTPADLKNMRHLFAKLEPRDGLLELSSVLKYFDRDPAMAFPFLKEM